METKPFRCYADFWPHYLAVHSHPWTKRFHFAGTSAALVLLVTLIATENWVWIPAVLVVGYAPAWISHFFIEKNKPATFGYPVWSFISDFRMLYLWITRQL